MSTPAGFHGRPAARRLRHRLEPVGLVADDERAAAADGEVHAAVRPLDDVHVHEVVEIAQQGGHLILQRQTCLGTRGAHRVVERRNLIHQRVDLLDGAAHAGVGLALRVGQPPGHLVERLRELGGGVEHVGARHRGRRGVGEARERPEHLGEPPVDRLAGGADARLDDLQDFGELLRAALGGHFLEDAALEQAIANGADARHFDAVAGAQRALRLDGGEVDGAPGVAGGVDVGDVVAGDLEAELLRREGAGGHREAGVEAGHQTLAFTPRPAYSASLRASGA